MTSRRSYGGFKDVYRKEIEQITPSGQLLLLSKCICESRLHLKLDLEEMDTDNTYLWLGSSRENEFLLLWHPQRPSQTTPACLLPSPTPAPRQRMSPCSVSNDPETLKIACSKRRIDTLWVFHFVTPSSLIGRNILDPLQEKQLSTVNIVRDSWRSEYLRTPLSYCFIADLCAYASTRIVYLAERRSTVRTQRRSRRYLRR